MVKELLKLFVRQVNTQLFKGVVLKWKMLKNPTLIIYEKNTKEIIAVKDSFYVCDKSTCKFAQNFSLAFLSLRKRWMILCVMGTKWAVL